MNHFHLNLLWWPFDWIYVQVVENEYPWLCSLKYRNNHICGMTLLSGPPHDTILVSLSYCNSLSKQRNHLWFLVLFQDNKLMSSTLPILVHHLTNNILRITNINLDAVLYLLSLTLRSELPTAFPRVTIPHDTPSPAGNTASRNKTNTRLLSR